MSDRASQVKVVDIRTECEDKLNRIREVITVLRGRIDRLHVTQAELYWMMQEAEWIGRNGWDRAWLNQRRNDFEGFLANPDCSGDGAIPLTTIRLIQDLIDLCTAALDENQSLTDGRDADCRCWRCSKKKPVRIP